MGNTSGFAGAVETQPRHALKVIAARWWNVSQDAAECWAAGMVTDFAMTKLLAPQGPALFVDQITGAGAWRHLARHLASTRPAVMVFRARSPVVEKRARQFGATLTHQDELGPRYFVAGDRLKQFIDHFSK